MKVKGTVKDILTPQSGTTSNGEWRKQQIIIQTGGEYPKDICLVGWGDISRELGGLAHGTEATFHIDVSSREYEGKWYTDVKCWKFDLESAETPSPVEAAKDFVKPVDLDGLPF